MLRIQLLPLLQVLSNLVNYRSFGFTKIVPRVGEKQFEAVVERSANASEAVILWKDVCSRPGHGYIISLMSISVERLHILDQAGGKSFHRETYSRAYLQLLSRPADYR